MSLRVGFGGLDENHSFLGSSVSNSCEGTLVFMRIPNEVECQEVFLNVDMHLALESDDMKRGEGGVLGYAPLTLMKMEVIEAHDVSLQDLEQLGTLQGDTHMDWVGLYLRVGRPAHLLARVRSFIIVAHLVFDIMLLRVLKDLIVINNKVLFGLGEFCNVKEIGDTVMRFKSKRKVGRSLSPLDLKKLNDNERKMFEKLVELSEKIVADSCNALKDEIVIALIMLDSRHVLLLLEVLWYSRDHSVLCVLRLILWTVVTVRGNGGVAKVKIAIDQIWVNDLPLVILVEEIMVLLIQEKLRLDGNRNRLKPCGLLRDYIWRDYVESGVKATGLGSMVVNHFRMRGLSTGDSSLMSVWVDAASCNDLVYCREYTLVTKNFRERGLLIKRS